MKKITITLLIIFLVLVAKHATYAATTATPSASETPTTSSVTSALNQQIDNLKDRIASRVAQLNLVDKKGFIGTVTDVAETKMTLSDLQGNIRFVDVDELTKFSSPSAKANFGISDIIRGKTVGILGLYNKESRRTLARFVDVLLLPKIVSGAVSAVDGGNFSLKVTTPDEKEISIDIETTTKTYIYGKSSGTVKSGFSKIQQGQRVMIVGYQDQQNKSNVIASRILLFPDIPVNPKIVLFKPGEFNVTPSTGSGTKLVPIIKNK